jgi:hypothetical protein
LAGDPSTHDVYAVDENGELLDSDKDGWPD